MPSWTIYHDPRSPKSRQALQRLKQAGIEPKVVEYLKVAPTERELEMLLMKLGLGPFQLVRKDDAVFKAKYKGLQLNDHEWIREMHAHPSLMERPIIVKDLKAVIAHTLVEVEELL